MPKVPLNVPEVPKESPKALLEAPKLPLELPINQVRHNLSALGKFRTDEYKLDSISFSVDKLLSSLYASSCEADIEKSSESPCEADNELDSISFSVDKLLISIDKLLINLYELHCEEDEKKLFESTSEENVEKLSEPPCEADVEKLISAGDETAGRTIKDFTAVIKTFGTELNMHMKPFFNVKKKFGKLKQKSNDSISSTCSNQMKNVTEANNDNPCKISNRVS